MSFHELTSTCPHCGSSDITTFQAIAQDTSPPVEISIRECCACTLAWQSPIRRSEGESAEFFSNAYRHSHSDPNSYFNPERRAATAELQVNLLIESVRTPSRLIDVGGGNGYFARAAAAHGFDVTLIDPALDVTQFENGPIEAIRATLGELKGRRYPVMTLWDVIEHIPEPDRFLESAIELIEEKGILILETGNYMCAARVSESLGHWIYQADHRWYFSPTSLCKLLTRLGFNECEVVPRVIRPGWNGEPHYLGPSRRRLIQQVLRRPLELPERLSEFWRMRQSSTWPWAGLEIFTVVARRA